MKSFIRWICERIEMIPTGRVINNAQTRNCCSKVRELLILHIYDVDRAGSTY